MSCRRRAGVALAIAVVLPLAAACGSSGGLVRTTAGASGSTASIRSSTRQTPTTASGDPHEAITARDIDAIMSRLAVPRGSVFHPRPAREALASSYLGTGSHQVGRGRFFTTTLNRATLQTFIDSHPPVGFAPNGDRTGPTATGPDGVTYLFQGNDTSAYVDPSVNYVVTTDDGKIGVDVYVVAYWITSKSSIERHPPKIRTVAVIATSADRSITIRQPLPTAEIGVFGHALAALPPAPPMLAAGCGAVRYAGLTAAVTYDDDTVATFAVDPACQYVTVHYRGASQPMLASGSLLMKVVATAFHLDSTFLRRG